MRGDQRDTVGIGAAQRGGIDAEFRLLRAIVRLGRHRARVVFVVVAAGEHAHLGVRSAVDLAGDDDGAGDDVEVLHAGDIGAEIGAARQYALIDAEPSRFVWTAPGPVR